MQKIFKLGDVYWTLVWLITKIAYRIVPVPLLFLWAQAKGFLLSFVSTERFAVKENLVKVFGHEKSEKEIRRIVRQHFEHLQRLQLSKIWHKIQGHAYANRCPVEGLPHLDAALRDGKGVILLTAHFGYSRQIKHFLRLRNYPAWIVGSQLPKDRPDPLTKFGRFVHERLLKIPEFVPAEENDLPTGLNVRPLVQALQRNEIVILTADGLRSSSVIEGRLLGVRTAFAAGSVSLARGTGAQILPAFVVDSGEGLIGLKLCIEPPLALQHTANPKDDCRANLERFARVFENYIQRYPHLSRWSKREFFGKRRKALKAEVTDRYAGHFKARKTAMAESPLRAVELNAE
jgi:KDO2-lipid IV(A) lauroyltransferase